MKKLFLIFVLTLCSVASVFAQISKGDPSAITIKTGNRPGKGDFGIFFGGGALFNSGFKFQEADKIEFSALPVINFKYFKTDNLELRLGLDVYREAARYSGVLQSDRSDSRLRNIEGFFYLIPGFAYHFSNSNILDVYVGAELPLGVDHLTQSYVDESTSIVSSRSPLVVGANGLIGLQAFVGNLPLAIGLEYGIGAKAYLGNKTKIEMKKGVNTVTFYQTDEDNPLEYSSLTALTGRIENIVRLTLSYYFN